MGRQLQAAAPATGGGPWEQRAGVRPAGKAQWPWPTRGQPPWGGALPVQDPVYARDAVVVRSLLSSWPIGSPYPCRRVKLFSTLRLAFCCGRAAIFPARKPGPVACVWFAYHPSGEARMSAGAARKWVKIQGPRNLRPMGRLGSPMHGASRRGQPGTWHPPSCRPSRDGSGGAVAWGPSGEARVYGPPDARRSRVAPRAHRRLGRRHVMVTSLGLHRCRADGAWQGEAGWPGGAAGPAFEGWKGPTGGGCAFVRRQGRVARGGPG